MNPWLAPAAVAARLLDPLQPLLLLGLRLWVGWQFLKSGWLKLADWDTTLLLFQQEYRVPLLSPAAAAVAGTAGELLFPVLLTLGLWGRLAAIGLSAVNALAVFAYAHVLLQDGFEAALGQHCLWGLMLLVVAVFGPGRWSIDGWWPAGAGRRY
ncbi:MAG: DoxX family protein [Gammaproteobacteria bacterium]|nr:DoxX family protein [Gammaproteobacteria bacterium]